MPIAERTPNSPSVLHVPSPLRAVPDPELAAAAGAGLLAALGRDVTSPHLADTPQRVAGAFTEMLTPRPCSRMTVDMPSSCSFGTSRSAPSASTTCFPSREGVAHIGHLPGDRILGLSKPASVLDYFARDLQMQERLSPDVADWLQAQLSRTRAEFLARCGLRS